MLPLASGAARGGLETTGGLLLHLCTLLRRLAAPRCTAALVRAADTHYDAPAPLPGTARCCCAVPARHVCRQRAPAGLLVNLRVFSRCGRRARPRLHRALSGPAVACRTPPGCRHVEGPLLGASSRASVSEPLVFRVLAVTSEALRRRATGRHTSTAAFPHRKSYSAC